MSYIIAKNKINWKKTKQKKSNPNPTVLDLIKREELKKCASSKINYSKGQGP